MAESSRLRNGTRCYSIAGLTVLVSADFPLNEHTYAGKFSQFRLESPGEDVFRLHLSGSMPSLAELPTGPKVYDSPPWVISHAEGSWTYVGVLPESDSGTPFVAALFDETHGSGTVYRPRQVWEQGGLDTLTSFPTDQMILARTLAERRGCYVHSCGVVVDGKGFLLVGHSGAGKSTAAKMLMDDGDILSDDRTIVRHWPEGFRIHGTWSHGEVEIVSAAQAALRAVLFLEQASVTDLVPVDGPVEQVGLVLTHMIKPLATPDWWEKMFDLAQEMTAAVPVYRLRFSLDSRLVPLLRSL